MVKNYYYFIAGILALVFAVTHALNGQNSVLPSLDVPSITTEIRTTFFYVWHIITAENLLFGIAFLFMAFQGKQSKARFAAWLIAIILLVRWTVIFVATLLYNPGGLQNILVDSIAIAIYVTLILLGTRVRDKERAVRPPQE